MRLTVPSILPLALACGTACTAELDPGLLASAQRDGTVDALIVFPDQSRPDLAPLARAADYRVRRRALVEALRERADAQQAPVRAWLDARGIAYRPFWIANLIAARLDVQDLQRLVQRDDVARIAANPRLAAPLPQPIVADAMPSAVRAVAWGVEKIGAPQAWAAGYTGQGVVIAGQDTGYQWDHPALKAQYRGWNGSLAQHDYNWHDAVHDAASPSCPADSAAPCDDYGHGTHTAGTFAGGDGDQQIGVAPGARWIGCRNMNGGVGQPDIYLECMQWLLAPTDLAGANPNPDLAPDVINNSWGCPADEGCTVGDELRGAVEQLVDAGIFFVASAGNDGPGCDSILTPPAIYEASFVVGATTTADSVWMSSSRGPASGSAEIRPDLVAPGVQVTSALPGDSYGIMSGTSMAGPHVAGTAALMISANPSLRGDPQRIAALLRASARTAGVTDAFAAGGCGGLTMADWPNYQAGYGRIDAWAAVQAALADADGIFADGFD